MEPENQVTSQELIAAASFLDHHFLNKAGGKDKVQELGLRHLVPTS